MLKSCVKFIAISQLLCLTACASVPLMSLPKLMSLDAETLDMSQLELAVRLEDNIGIKPGSANVDVSLKQDATGVEIDNSFTLETPDATLTPFLQRQEKPGYKIHRFKMTPAQAEIAQQFRQEALELKAKDKREMELTFSASVGFCQPRNQPAFDEVNMVFYIRTDSQKEFFTLIKEQNLEFGKDFKEKQAENPNYCDDV